MRLWIYLFPALMDVVLGSVFFLNTVRIAELPGSSATAAAMVLPIWAITYMIACLVISPLNTERNTVALLIVACAAQIACAGAFIAVDDPWAIYWLMGPQAVATALFFVPFQLFMKTVERGRPAAVVRSAALYTFSWSAGIACGPFIAGFLWKAAGWRWCHVLNALIAAATAGGIVLLRRYADDAGAPEPSEPGATIDPGEYASMPDLAWLGWLGSGAGFVAIQCIRGVFPSAAKAYSISKPEQGIVLAVVAGVHALFALTLVRSRRWMYQGSTVALFASVGVAGLLLFAAATTTPAYCLAAACFGVYSAAFSFYFVFHALVHPSRAGKYVAVNESVVGVCTILGPLLGGVIADGFGLDKPYLAAAGFIVVAAALQTIVHRRHALEAARLLR